MAEQQDITETVRQIVENSELLDASVLEQLPQLRAAKKLVFSLAEVTAMREALRTEKVLTVAELHRIIAETKRMEDEAAKAAELDGSLLIGGIYLFDQEAPLDLSTSRNERPEAVLDYEDLSDDELKPGSKSTTTSILEASAVLVFVPPPFPLETILDRLHPNPLATLLETLPNLKTIHQTEN